MFTICYTQYATILGTIYCKQCALNSTFCYINVTQFVYDCRGICSQLYINLCTLIAINCTHNCCEFHANRAYLCAIYYELCAIGGQFVHICTIIQHKHVCNYLHKLVYLIVRLFTICVRFRHKYSPLGAPSPKGSLICAIMGRPIGLIAALVGPDKELFRGNPALIGQPLKNRALCGLRPY